MRPDEIDALAWSRSTDVRAGGLLPAIVQDADNQRVLMLGWMSREALQVTLDTGWVTFHSRSRGRLWTKGETSGHGLARSEEHTSELQSLMRISYAVFCLKKKKEHTHNQPKRQATRDTTTKTQ